MDEDKFEKTIEIILQNQAQFYADMQRLEESQKELQKSQKRSEERIEILQNVTVNILEAVKLTNENLGKLSNKVDKLADTVDKLTDAQIETDERLNAVILMAEKFFSNQNGKNN